MRIPAQVSACKDGDCEHCMLFLTVYNAVVRMCLVEMPQALQKILDLPAITDIKKSVLPSSKGPRWNKIKMDVKLYLSDVLQV